MTFDIIGHGAVVEVLKRELPPVTLLLGPASVGKQTIARYLAQHHRIGVPDTDTVEDGFGIDKVRSLRHWVNVAPFGRFKLVLAQLDGTSEPAYNALLKTLEEPPPTVRFLLSASTRPPDTVISRCVVFRLGLLSDDELRTVLRMHNVPVRDLDRAVALGRGQVQPALSYAGKNEAHDAVLALVKALAACDRAGFERVVKTFDDTSYGLLVTWLVEAITGQWRVFVTGDDHGLTRNPLRLRQMLVALSALPGARARLGVRVALEPFLAGS